MVALWLLSPAAGTADTGDKREVPNYDGRADPPPTGDYLLFVPRLLLAPAYLVSEYVVRRPLGAVATLVEEQEVPEKLLDLFTFGADGETVVVPTALVDFGFGSNVGVYFRTRDLLIDGHRLSAHYAFGGTGWHTVSVADSFRPAKGAYRIQLSGAYLHRPDGLFHGNGPRSSDLPTFFGYRLGEVALDASFAGYRESHIDLGANLRSMRFASDTRFGPSITERIAAGDLATPVGLDGYQRLAITTAWVFDNRNPRPGPGGGLRAVAQLDYLQGLSAPHNKPWLHLGGELGAYWDASGAQHVLGLSLHVHDLLGGDGAIPFTELLEPSSMEILRGFRPGRLFGGSLVAAVAEYSWPVWVFVDGFLHAAVGNTFAQHFSDYAHEDLRLSMGLGFRTTGSRDHALELIAGFGTETFGQGTRPQSLRFLLGGTSAF